MPYFFRQSPQMVSSSSKVTQSSAMSPFHKAHIIFCQYSTATIPMQTITKLYNEMVTSSCNQHHLVTKQQPSITQPGHCLQVGAISSNWRILQYQHYTHGLAAQWRSAPSYEPLQQARTSPFYLRKQKVKHFPEPQVVTGHRRFLRFSARHQLILIQSQNIAQCAEYSLVLIMLTHGKWLAELTCLHINVVYSPTTECSLGQH